MAHEKEYFELLKLRLRWHYLLGFFDVPILILLWYLKYRTGFWVYLGLLILTDIVFGFNMIRIAHKAGLESF